jgi:GT2 family glycosyltransferase
MEVVVVADGPDPRVGPVIAGWRPTAGAEIRLLTQARSGPATARNLGARHAHGDLVAFTDDDCLPTRQWATLLVGALEREPGALVGGRVVNGLTSLPSAEAAQLVIDVVQAHYSSRARPGRFLTSNNVALSRAAFLALGGFDEVFTGAAAEDRDLSERAADAGYPIVHCAALVEHRHALTPASLWRQQYNYGRGARTLARRRAERRAPPVLPEPTLYAELLAAAWRAGSSGPAGSLRMVGLVALTQAAYACGLLAGAPRPRTPGS